MNFLKQNFHFSFIVYYSAKKHRKQCTFHSDTPLQKGGIETNSLQQLKLKKDFEFLKKSGAKVAEELGQT